MIIVDGNAARVALKVAVKDSKSPGRHGPVLHIFHVRSTNVRWLGSRDSNPNWLIQSPPKPCP